MLAEIGKFCAASKHKLAYLKECMLTLFDVCTKRFILGALICNPIHFYNCILLQRLPTLFGISLLNTFMSVSTTTTNTATL